MQSLGLSKQYGKKGSEVSQLLKKMFVLSFLLTAEFCDCFALECLSNLLKYKWVEHFCDYLLENYIDTDSSFPPPVWSDCTASSVRTINARELLHAHFNSLFTVRIVIIFSCICTANILNVTYIKMWSVTTRRFKKLYTFKKEELISS